MKRLSRFLPLAACSIVLVPVYSQATANAPQPSVSLSLDLLSDTGGVNVSPYVKNLVSSLKQHWLPLPEQARKQRPAGPEETVIRFTIAADGHVVSMRLEDSANDTELDKAAWHAASETQYPPPPSGMRDPNLSVRVHFTVK